MSKLKLAVIPGDGIGPGDLWQRILVIREIVERRG